MKFVKLYNGESLPVIGLGTWTMGGGMRPEPSKDATALNALNSALDMGYTHIDTAEMYAGGHSEELVGQAIRGRSREKLFITTKIEPSNLRYKSARRSIEGSLKRLGTDYIDLYLIHWPSHSIPLAESFRALNEAVRDGKIRHLGVSNFGMEDLKQAQRYSEVPIATNQVPYSVSTRRYQHNGVIDYCQQQKIVITAYSPIEEGNLRPNPKLTRIADQHKASPYQVALAWLVSQPLVISIPMSQDPQHLEENLAAAEIELTSEEIAEINTLA